MMTTINKGSLWPYSSKPYSIHVILFFQLELLISPTKPKKSNKKKRREREKEREKQEKGKTPKRGRVKQERKRKGQSPREGQDSNHNLTSVGN
jgi:hypothetical protein